MKEKQNMFHTHIMKCKAQYNEKQNINKTTIGITVGIS
jgi:hypothetical protein